MRLSKWPVLCSPSAPFSQAHSPPTTVEWKRKKIQNYCDPCECILAHHCEKFDCTNFSTTAESLGRGPESISNEERACVRARPCFYSGSSFTFTCTRLARPEPIRSQFDYLTYFCGSRKHKTGYLDLLATLRLDGRRSVSPPQSVPVHVCFAYIQVEFNANINSSSSSGIESVFEQGICQFRGHKTTFLELDN